MGRLLEPAGVRRGYQKRSDGPVAAGHDRRAVFHLGAGLGRIRLRRSQAAVYLVLEHGNRPAGFSVDPGLTISQNGIREILYQRKMNVRVRRVPLGLLSALRLYFQSPFVQTVNVD